MFKKDKNEIQLLDALKQSFDILPINDRRKLFAVTLIQIFLSLLDLVGVLAVGFLGALSVSGIQSKTPGTRASSLLSFLGISNFTFQQQAAMLGLFAVTVLTLRTILSIFFTRRILFFMSRRGALISSNLISKFLSLPLLTIQKWSTQAGIYAVTHGVQIIVLQVLALLVVLISDISLLIILVIGLFLVDPVTALSTVVIFGSVSVALYLFMHVRAGKLGAINAGLAIQSSEKVAEVFSSYRESVVRNRRDFYAREIAKTRFLLADTSAEIGFMPYISKYIIETSVIVGAVLIGGIQFLMQDSSRAVATLAVFVAAGSRIAPAVLRIQQGSISIKSSLGMAMPTLKLISFLKDVSATPAVDDEIPLIHENFDPKVIATNVTFTYPEGESENLYKINFEANAGEIIALVGPSGAGKTTLVDVLLGIIKPDEGNIFISDLPPLEAIEKWPGAIAYVPQDVLIINGSIRENVALGYPIEKATDKLVHDALQIASLEDFVLSLPDALETNLGERGARLSGGQRQRIGIARALFTKPKLLVLDEATSSLDSMTEESISNDIKSLKGNTTVIIIAHRLSTVKDADRVVYIEQGRILAVGTFDEVRSLVPDFDKQARLTGIPNV
jgi:ABC-type multidrug transport system fused ATPase/permease subunit